MILLGGLKMKLIIGGAYQGKKQYALENYSDENILEDFHLLVLDMLKKDIDVMAYVKEHINEYRDKVIICDDISCGVVPMDTLMRKWREAVGHTLGFLAKESDEVVRVFCGIGTRLK